MEQTNAKNEFTLEIESLAYGPYGIGRIENQVIMVPATVPGDKISARVTDSKGHYSFGEKVRLLEPSPLRQTPPCPYVNDCGGCPWQQVQYEAQLKAKEPGEFIPRDDAACERLLNQTSIINGLILHGGKWRKEWGQTAVTVRSDDGICLKVKGDVFTQINAEGNRTLLTKLLAAGGFGKNDQVLELYSGAGNFTLSIAKQAREVVAVESYRQSIDSGKRSAQLNAIANIRWICAHVPVAVERFAKQRERFSKIILDPPRAGAKGIELNLTLLDAQKILYVSCNPATLARDLSALARHGYKLTFVQPIDLFPHTFHVETLAEMTR